MSDTSETLSNDNDRYTVPALERGLRLLACFTPSQPVWSAPDLARTLALPRSTVFRMLTTLENMGYLQRSGTEYRLGLSVLRLGYDYLSTQPLAQLAEPVLQSLCDRLGFTTNLALLDGTSVVYVARIAPAGAFQGAVRVGSRLPAHATVLGRALLQDRERGYAMGEGFYEPGVSSIAAPVRDAQGRIIAGLGMAVAFTEIAPGRMAHWVEQVREAAVELTGHLRTQHPGFLR